MRIKRLLLIVVLLYSYLNIKAQSELMNYKDSLGLYISALEMQNLIVYPPLLVIDGIAINFDDYQRKNQPILKSDIKQIDYLSKDSQGAINIYGERGKNGVVLIKTQKLEEKSAKSSTDNKILFMVGNKQISQDELQKIDSKDIIAIDVIKDKDTIKKYTKDDYDGVVIITMKKKEKRKKKD